MLFPISHFILIYFFNTFSEILFHTYKSIGYTFEHNHHNRLFAEEGFRRTEN